MIKNRRENRFQIKRGDTRSPLKVKLFNSDGVIDLTGANVKLVMTDWNKKAILIDDVATIESIEGIVSYLFSKEQTDRVGSYFCEFEITFQDGRTETFPTQGQIILTINDNLRGEIVVTPPTETLDGGNFTTLVFDSVEDGGDFTSPTEESLDGGTF